MLFSLNKHYLKNFKNFIISQYCSNIKNLDLDKFIFLKISFLKKSFFLAAFFLYTFCIFKFKFKNTFKHINLILPKIFFFFLFNKLYYPFLLNLKTFSKKSKGLISLNYTLDNFFLLPISTFFYKSLRWKQNKKILLNLNFFFKKSKYKYIKFLSNFFQIPLF